MLLLLCSSLAWGIPKSVNFQVTLADKEKGPLNGVYNAITTIYGERGEPLWQETLENLSFVNGVADLELGLKTPFTSSLLDVVKPTLGISVNGQEVMITMESFPFAIFSKYAEVAQSIEWSNIKNRPTTLNATQVVGFFPSLISSGPVESRAIGFKFPDGTVQTTAASRDVPSGDVTGAIGRLSVVRIQNRPVASTLPTSGQVLKWNSSANRWEPGAVTADIGTGIPGSKFTNDVGYVTSGSGFITTSGTETFTNKTINRSSNTITNLNIGDSDISSISIAKITGLGVLATRNTIVSANISSGIPVSKFTNDAGYLTSGSGFITTSGTETFTNKTINRSSNTLTNLNIGDSDVSSISIAKITGLGVLATKNSIDLGTVQATGTLSSARVSGAYTGLTGVGTISSGVWNGTSIGNAYIDDTITLTNLTQVTNRAISDTTGTLAVNRG